jgi:RNA polymerase sigma-70 factor (ECF subfamily)
VRDAAADTLLLIGNEFAPDDGDEPASFPDERLELMFVCAHSAIAAHARSALMLQTVLGLDAARIASAFLLSPATLSQRLVRAKARIRDTGIRFEVPPPAQWRDRLAEVMEAIYAAYGSGWIDAAGADPRRHGLALEAIELARTLVQLLPHEREPRGLLALLLFCQARAGSRRDERGDYVPLTEQDLARWNHELLAEAEAQLLAVAGQPGPIGVYQLEAALQSAHSQRRLGAPVPAAVIVALYDGVLALHGHLGARVGRACALADAHGPEAGLAALDEIEPPAVAGHQPWWAARAELLVRAGHADEAAAAYERAAGLSEDPALRRFLLARRAAQAPAR